MIFLILLLLIPTVCQGRPVPINEDEQENLLCGTLIHEVKGDVIVKVSIIPHEDLSAEDVRDLQKKYCTQK